jgi:hypothetical protein
MIIPNPRTSPRPHNKQPNPLSKRQQKKQRAEQRRQAQQKQGDYQPNQQNQQNQKKQKNKNKSNQNQNQNQDHQKSTRQSDHGNQSQERVTSKSQNDQTKYQDHVGGFEELPYHVDGTENGPHNDNNDARSTHVNNWQGWGDDSDKRDNWDDFERGGRQSCPARKNCNYSSGHDNHHQSKRTNSRHGSPQGVSRNQSNTGGRGRNGSRQNHSSSNNDHKGNSGNGKVAWEHDHGQLKDRTSQYDNRQSSSDRGSKARSPSSCGQHHDHNKQPWPRDNLKGDGGWDDDDQKGNGGWGGAKYKGKQATSKNDTNCGEGKRSWSREGRVHQDKNRWKYRRDDPNSPWNPPRNDHRENSPAYSQNAPEEPEWGTQVAADADW